jgi:hypothetical protein
MDFGYIVYTIGNASANPRHASNRRVLLGKFSAAAFPRNPQNPQRKRVIML